MITLLSLCVLILFLKFILKVLPAIIGFAFSLFLVLLQIVGFILLVPLIGFFFLILDILVMGLIVSLVRQVV